MSGLSAPEENTLGVIFGRRGRGGVSEQATATKARVQAPGAGLGTSHLAIGAGVLCSIQAVFGLAMFATHLDDYPAVIAVVAAWLLFITAFATVSLTIASRGDRLPGWMFLAYLGALAVVIALDFVAIWSLGDIGRFATASVTAGFGLIAVVTLSAPWKIITADMVVLAAFVIAIAATTESTAQTIPAQVTTIAIAVLPPLFAVFIVRRFRRMVQLELDRVLVQSTVSAPRLAVGMLASEELARLDLAAEELLDSVASGRSPLPLGPKTASSAASLATELRLHLIEGRRETWLYHAITESEQLGKSVTLTDPGSLAGLLDAQQRDGLFGTIWALVADTTKSGATAQVVLGPVMPAPNQAARRTIAVPIVITTTAVARNRVDASTWSTLGKVGRFVHSIENSSLRVDIQCIVPNPAQQ